MSLLLKNALLFDLKSSHHNKKKDILIKDGHIESFKTTSVRRIIDCEGKIVIPSFFDLNATFCDPGFEWKEDIRSGSLAAAHGGFTDVNLLPSTKPAVQTKSDVEYLFSKASNGVDLHVSGALSENLEGENLTEMMDLNSAGAKSFSDGNTPIWNSKLLMKALQYTSQFDAPIFQNARDRHLSEDTHMHEGVVSTKLGLRAEPSLSEELIIGRDLSILKYAGGKMHFSKVSTAESIELIRRAKKNGMNVTCDVAVHHLLFTDESVEEFDSIYKSLPPFRTEKDRKALVKALNEGTIDAICSGHSPADQEGKQLEFDLADAGAISLQTFLSALLRVKGVSKEVLFECAANGGRRILGEEEVRLEKGSVAKLAIIDLNKEWILNDQTNVSKSRNSPFWNQKLAGTVYATINREIVSVFG